MPVKYIPYYPDTVEGQSVLNNITRTQRVLRYRENDKVYDRIKRGLPFYETELIETIGETSDNLVIRGECISACAYLKEKGIKVDLVYIDPPFASGADYAKKVYIRKNPKLAEKIAEAELQMDIEELRAFEEKMYGDIWKKEDYLNWMYENLIAIKSVMSDTASIYVHLDWHIGHYVKILMDEVFGEDNFVNEIIWCYSRPTISNQKHFTKLHDTIFWYAHNKEKYESNVNRVRIEYSAKTKERNKYGAGGSKYSGGSSDRITHKDGKIPEDYWYIPMVIGNANENVNYSTQKPEAIIERILKVSSNEGMLVADFFGGSGVTAKVANDLARKFIHVDIGINSIQTTRDRLKEAGADFRILEIKDGVSLFRNPQQTMDKLAKLIPNLLQNFAGLSKFWFGAIIGTSEGTIPVYVPNLLNTQEKVLDKPTINTIINQELQNLDSNIKKVIVYYIDIDDYNELEKFISDINDTEIEVELKDLKNLLHDVIFEDIIEYSINNTLDGFEVEITKFISDRLIQKINEFNDKGNLQLIDKGKIFNPITISDEGLELIELISLDYNNSEGPWHSSTEIKIDKLGYVIKDGNKTKTFWDGKITSSNKPLRLKVRNISGDESIIVIE